MPKTTQTIPSNSGSTFRVETVLVADYQVISSGCRRFVDLHYRSQNLQQEFAIGGGRADSVIVFDLNGFNIGIEKDLNPITQT